MAGKGIKVLAIRGSPRVGGNSDTLLEHALKGILEVAPGADILVVRASDLDVSACPSCNGCAKDGVCKVDDDMQSIYSGLDGADVLVVSAPVYFMGLPAQLKAMIDRCQSVWYKNFVLKGKPKKGKRGKKAKGAKDKKGRKVAGFLSPSGQDEEVMFVGPDKTIIAWFATLGFEYESKLFVPGMDQKVTTRKVDEDLDRARGLGRALARAVMQ
jgi:multimeric flavodoxin WrbA